MTRSSAVDVSVIVPTYRRPEHLLRCLAGVAAQRYGAFEVIVVVRDTDDQTKDALQSVMSGPLPLRIVAVARSGVVAAMSAGLEAAKGEIVALLDDDAVPEPEWLMRLVKYFTPGSDIAGAGGKDRLYRNGKLVAGTADVVGRVCWFGRHIGNHHLGYGAARDVDVLKGVNCAFRTQLLREVGFETRLLGSGAQVHWELCLCLTLRRRGWRLIYDPSAVVAHHSATRYDEDQREGFSYEARFNEAHNETLALLQYLGPLNRIVFVAWAVLVGTRAVPGIAQLMRFAICQKRWIGPHVRAALAGRKAGWRTWRAGLHK